MSNLEQYRASPMERERTADILRIMPKNRESLLDIGAREGFFSRLLIQQFATVTALDLERPSWSIPGVTTVAGDVTKLDFPDSSFDCVFCAEVLEHIPRLEDACRELARVARHEIVIGVPYRQDLRLGRMTCAACGKRNPPWGHVNSFDEKRLDALFPGLEVVSTTYVGRDAHATNPLSTLLMDLAGNPWGPYNQDEGCLYCSASMKAPSGRGLFEKACGRAAVWLNAAQSPFTKPHAAWIHRVLRKRVG